MTRCTRFLDELNHAYEALHTAKEDAFWTAYMGLASDANAARADLDRKEIELARFVRDPARLAAVDALLADASKDAAPTADERLALEGWRATFAAHVIELPAAQELSEAIVEQEGELANARANMHLGYTLPGAAFTEASSVKLGVLLASDRDQNVRRAAFDGLRSIERHVLEHGFLDVIRERNRLGRMLGGEDYYDWKVRRVEGMSKREVFALLDELELRTRERAKRSLDELRAQHGDAQVTPWNIRYLVSGDVTAEQDPYFPFAKSLERWGRSFAALGIEYHGATLVLDLVDRKGKYENGFMHGPVVAWRERGALHPARIQFTANAIPNLVGAGRRATETLFHEGGHAAHFANIDMPAPCFGQEFAPTSVAFSETQSMFCDSLLGDADWQARYARTLDGRAMPAELIEKGLRASQPFAAWSLRSMFTICYVERALYEIPDAELTLERVLATVREIERKLLFLDEGSPRPALSVPHLIAGESSAYYHGYVLAEMAVQQTRAFFLQRDGHLLDNPKIGPALRAHYWQPGNSRSFREFIAALTGKPLSAEALATKVNRSTDEALARAHAALAREREIPPHSGPIELGAEIRVMHGTQPIASTDAGSFAACCERFEDWIGALARA